MKKKECSYPPPHYILGTKEHLPKHTVILLSSDPTKIEEENRGEKFPKTPNPRGFKTKILQGPYSYTIIIVPQKL